MGWSAVDKDTWGNWSSLGSMTGYYKIDIGSIFRIS